MCGCVRHPLARAASAIAVKDASWSQNGQWDLGRAVEEPVYFSLLLLQQEV